MTKTDAQFSYLLSEQKGGGIRKKTAPKGYFLKSPGTPKKILPRSAAVALDSVQLTSRFSQEKNWIKCYSRFQTFCF